MVCKRCKIPELWFKRKKKSSRFEIPQAAQKDIDSDYVLHNWSKCFYQNELNGLVRDLGLSKNGSQLIGFRLKEKNLLSVSVTHSWKRDFGSY